MGVQRTSHAPAGSGYRPSERAVDSTPMSETRLRLHLGCGKRDFGSSWIHIDGGDHPHLHSHDITTLPFPDGAAQEIYASHLLPYFDREEARPLLAEWLRVLEPGGTLRLAVSDFETIAKLYAAGSYSLDRFLGPLFGRWPMGEATVYHKTSYDFDSLKELLEGSGYTEIQRYDWRQTDHHHIDDHSQAYLPHMDKENGTLISLNVQASTPI